MARCFAKVSEEEIEEGALFCPSDLVNTTIHENNEYNYQ